MIVDLFDPEKRLFELKVVIITIWIYVLLTFFFFLRIPYIHYVDFLSLSNWDVSAKGFNYFIELYQAPIWMIGTSIPLLALFAANHRSSQTKKQIKELANQNIFSNHYKHLEEYLKFIKSVELDNSEHYEIFNTLVINKHIFHRDVFGKGVEYQAEWVSALCRLLYLLMRNIELFEQSKKQNLSFFNIPEDELKNIEKYTLDIGCKRDRLKAKQEVTENIGDSIIWKKLFNLIALISLLNEFEENTVFTQQLRNWSDISDFQHNQVWFTDLKKICLTQERQIKC